MAFNYYGCSDFGQQEIMEDFFDGFIVNNNVLFVCIADGLGAMKGTDVASILSIYEFKQYMINNLKTDNINDIEKEMKTAIYMINRMVYGYHRMHSKKYGNFSSTLTIVAINLKKEIVVAHVGNTRFYLFRENKITQLTRDDTIAQELLEKGEIKKVEYKAHPERNVLTRYIGMPEITPTITKGRLLYNDVIILLTNGVYEMLDNEKIEQILINTESSQQASEWMIQGANEMGGIDNSAVIISYINWE